MHRTPTTAFILGAGLGTRLRPLTSDRPKPLVTVCGKPLITFAFDHLLADGLSRWIVNTHHRADEYAKVFPDNCYRGCPIDFRYEPELLETGGGIKNIGDLAGNAPLLVYNGDVLTDLPLGPLLDAHRDNGALVTMALRSGGGPLRVSLDADSGRVRDIRGKLGTGLPDTHLFTGIYILQPGVFDLIPPNVKISIVPVLLDIIRDQDAVAGVEIDDGAWRDLGTVAEYLDIHREVMAQGWRPSFPVPEPWPVLSDPEALGAPGSGADAACWLGEGVRLGADARLADSVALAGSQIRAGSRLERCLILENAIAEGVASGSVFAPVPNGGERERIGAFLKQAMATDSLELDPLDKGGSDRKFYRMRTPGRPARIVLHYVGEKSSENDRYVAVARLFRRIGVNAPEIAMYHAGEGLIAMEDLGQADLWAFRNHPWDVRRPLVEAALRQVSRIHARARQALQAHPFDLHVPFDAALYRWEREYCFEQCFGRHFGVKPECLETLRSAGGLELLGARLAALPRALVHRDFQSQNIMIRDGQAWLIDFQGLRAGLPEYDVASLLYDPYVTWPRGAREDAIDLWRRIAREEGAVISSDPAVFFGCAVQRLLQALGAYGYLGIVKNKPRFLGFIPTALASLREVAGQCPGLDGLSTFLDDLPV